jgi:hypothetical protein
MFEDFTIHVREVYKCALRNQVVRMWLSKLVPCHILYCAFFFWRWRTVLFRKKRKDFWTVVNVLNTPFLAAVCFLYLLSTVVACFCISSYGGHLKLYSLKWQYSVSYGNGITVPMFHTSPSTKYLGFIITIYFMNLRAIVWEAVVWVHLAHVMDQWRSVGNTVMNLRVS